jgi:hypothetical protein
MWTGWWEDCTLPKDSDRIKGSRDLILCDAERNGVGVHTEEEAVPGSKSRKSEF